MIIDVLERNGITAKKKTANEYCSPCPFCGGEDRFCIWVDKNEYWCRQCNKKGDEIQLLRDFEGLTFKEAAERTGKPVKQFAKITETYDYIDSTGDLLFQVVRYDNKDFKQRRPHKTQKDKWIWSIDNIDRVLYRLPEILPSEYVLFVEGEKDVENLRKLGFVATTNPMGAEKLPGQQEKWGLLDCLSGKRVYIIPDNDGPGKNHAKQCASLLSDKLCIIKIISLDGLKEHQDVSDFIKIHGPASKSLIIEKVTATPQWNPPKQFYTIQDLLSLPSDNHLPIISKGIMPYGSHILIAGESGIGKSLLRLELAIHLAMGWDWLGFEIRSAKKVAIFQFENTEIMERNRARRMIRALGIDPSAFGNRLKWASRLNRPDLTLKGDKPKLMGEIAKLECDVIIYDCLSNIHTANENDNIKMRNVLDTITDINTELDTSCILIHHYGKPVEGVSSNYRTRGASSIIDWAVTAMGFLEKHNESRLLRELHFVKVRDGPKPKPILLERSENFIHSVTDEGTLCSPVMVREILESLGGEVEKQTVLIDEIMRETSCSMRSAKTYIKRAEDMREIESSGNGRSKFKGYKVK